MRGRLLGRIALVALGLLLALVLAEVGLRIAAGRLEPPPPAAGGSDAFDILCVGDSFTYGLGSEDGRGYPEHLQGLLDAAWGPGAAQVHNVGLPGQNSPQAADALPGQLGIVRPELMILLVGHNNTWNYNDLHLAPGEGSVALRGASLLDRLRVVRLLRIALGWDLGRQERAEAAARGIDAAGMGADPQAEVWYRWQDKRAKQDKLQNERAHWQAVLAEHPDDVYALLQVAQLAETAGQADEARSLRARAEALDAAAVARLEAQQRSIEAWHRAQHERGQDAHLERRPASRARLFEALGEEDEAEPDALLDEVLRRDLRAMVEAARAAGAQVILMSYASSTKQASPILAESARALGVPFVDQEARFDALAAEGVPLADLFVLDGHCTSLGYLRMAEGLVPEVEGARAAGGL
ncbi:MAG: GDSL-type esterase/lipase family protein [Pseudomonadota bacterium]